MITTETTLAQKRSEANLPDRVKDDDVDSFFEKYLTGGHVYVNNYYGYEFQLGNKVWQYQGRRGMEYWYRSN